MPAPYTQADVDQGKAKAPGGRPLKFQDAEALQQQINDFFDSIKQTNEPCTMMGLCLYLDVDRKVFWRYADHQGEEARTPELCDICSRARDRVMRYYEGMPVAVNDKLGNWSDRMLNRMGWSSESESGSGPGGITVILLPAAAEPRQIASRVVPELPSAAPDREPDDE